MKLRNFGRDAWKSRIRHRVTVTERYKNLPRWTGTETADIVYYDVDGQLANFLARQDSVILSNLSLSNLRKDPTFYIEVKSTLGAEDTPFFCSQSQVDKMESIRVKERSGEIYVIARVFELGAAEVGLTFHVDPASLRERGDLIFTAEKYTVVKG